MKTAIDDAELYDHNYFNGYYTNDKLRDAMYLQEEARVRSRSDFGHILDVGCGVGGFLQIFDDRWTKYGYEPSEFAAEKAAGRGIQMVRNINAVSSESMDVVILRGTLQHMDNPVITLFQAYRVLRKGGLLVILATPDIDSLVYKIWGELPPLDAPRNWILFGGKYLTNIIKRLGFSDVEVLHPYWKTPYAQPVKDFTKFFLSLFFGYRKFAFFGNMMEIYARKLSQCG
jgi:SAM-dependent methyltransferase